MKSPVFFTKQNILKLSFESALIIFSVLLALFLNEYRGQLKEDKQKKLAMDMVKVELVANLETLNKWRVYHEKVLKNLNTALQNDSSTSLSLFNENGDLLEGLIPNGVVQSLLNDTSWQTLKSSSVSSAIDLNLMFVLSNLYKFQAQGVELTLQNVLKILSSRESLEKHNQRTTIILLRNAFRELVSQEIFLIAYYQKTIDEIVIPED